MQNNDEEYQKYFKLVVIQFITRDKRVIKYKITERKV